MATLTTEVEGECSLGRCSVKTLWNEGHYPKILSSEKVLLRRNIVKESAERLILERKKKIGTHNMRYAWMVAGITISGYLCGAALGTFSKMLHGRKREEAKESGRKREEEESA